LARGTTDLAEFRSGMAFVCSGWTIHHAKVRSGNPIHLYGNEEGLVHARARLPIRVREATRDQGVVRGSRSGIHRIPSKERTGVGGIMAYEASGRQGSCDASAPSEAVHANSRSPWRASLNRVRGNWENHRNARP
jgi:hypothetical protein